MKIGFYKLWPKGPVLTSYVTVTDNGEIVWGYNSYAIKQLLSDFEHPKLGGRFDINNPEHIKMLPQILTGNHFFAAEIDVQNRD